MYYYDSAFRHRVLGKMRNPKQLYLSWCDEITEVSTLENVHTLKLKGCHKITDVCALGNVHTLNLPYHIYHSKYGILYDY